MKMPPFVLAPLANAAVRSGYSCDHQFGKRESASRTASWALTGDSLVIWKTLPNDRAPTAAKSSISATAMSTVANRDLDDLVQKVGLAVYLGNAKSRYIHQVS
jgi:hypothetical protein